MGQSGAYLRKPTFRNMMQNELRPGEVARV